MLSGRKVNRVPVVEEEDEDDYPSTDERSELVSPSTRSSRHSIPLPSRCTVVLLLVIAILLTICVYLASLVHGAVPATTINSDISSMLQRGVDIGQPVSVPYNVSARAVSQLRELVDSNGLVSSYNNTLMVGITNYGYRDFAYNWLCFVRRLQLTNFLLACVDEESCDELRLLGYGKHIVMLDELFPESISSECKGRHTHNFRSTCFNRHTTLKTRLVLTSLLAGYNTVLTDMDISLVHNPFLYMPLTHDWEIQLEPHELCTGWYYNAASATSIRIQAEVLHLLERYVNNKLDDQAMYNVWMAYRLFVHSEDDLARYIFPLNRQLFPIGQHYGDTRAVLWHNNWLTSADKKRNRSRLTNTYLYDETETVAATKAYIDRLSLNVTRFDASGNRTAIWRAVNGHAVATPPSSHLLVCKVCVPCANNTPAAPPLRSTFPGPLLTHNFTQYGSAWPSHLVYRVLPH